MFKLHEQFVSTSEGMAAIFNQGLARWGTLTLLTKRSHWIAFGPTITPAVADDSDEEIPELVPDSDDEYDGPPTKFIIGNLCKRIPLA